MLPQIIHHSYTRSTRDISTNFPHHLTGLYTSFTPRSNGKNSILPPIYVPTNNVSLPTKLKKIIHEKRIQKNLEKSKIKKDRINKGKTAEMLWENFDILIRNSEISQLTLEEILEKAYYIYQNRQLNVSAKKIQESWGKYCLNKEKKKIRLQRETAAIKIQREWRKFKKRVIDPVLKREKEIKAAIVIQRFYRGYRSRMKFSVLKGRVQIEKNMQFFDSVRNQMLHESALVIARFWKKYKVKSM